MVCLHSAWSNTYPFYKADTPTRIPRTVFKSNTTAFCMRVDQLPTSCNGGTAPPTHRQLPCHACTCHDRQFHVMHAHATTDRSMSYACPCYDRQLPCHACPCHDRQLPCHMYAHAATDSSMSCMPMLRQTASVSYVCPCHDRQFHVMHAHATTDSFRVICMPMPRQTASVSYACTATTDSSMSYACPCHDRQLPCHMYAHATTLQNSMQGGKTHRYTQTVAHLSDTS